MSESVAVFVTIRVVRLARLRSPCGGKTGKVFTSVTMTVNELVALRLGEPSSVTMVVKQLVLGPWASFGVQIMMPSAEILALVTSPPAFVTVSE